MQLCHIKRQANSVHCSGRPYVTLKCIGSSKNAITQKNLVLALIFLAPCLVS